ncbi:hypothetical protein ACVWZ4_000012 [Bradyrhizobium sp. USDA 4472]
MIIVGHRPPLKRIDFGRKPRPPSPPVIDLDCIAKFQEQDRIWDAIQATAQASQQGDQ